MRVTFGWLPAAALLGFGACHRAPPLAKYALTRSVRGHLEIEFAAARGEGATGYRAHTEAWVRLHRADTGSGPLAVELTVDSAAYSDPERDSAEIRFLRAGLARYRATWRMGPKGHVLDLDEAPVFPPGEFGFRLGTLLAAALPVFPSPGAAAADTQSLFDPASDRTRRVQSCSEPDRGTPGGELDGVRNSVLHLADVGRDGIDLAGRESFQFDTSLGFPRQVSEDLHGLLPADSDSGFALQMDLRLRFELLGSAP